jgi:D-3-phosphoglycerate dehydrogenase
MAYDPLPAREWASQNGVQLVSMADALTQSDIVTIHASKTSTTPVLGAREISLLKRGSYVINTARGGLVDETALISALSVGAVAGAFLDVFETEPYSGPLCSLPNVLLTPHIGSYALEARAEMESEAIDNLLSWHQERYLQ